MTNEEKGLKLYIEAKGKRGILKEISEKLDVNINTIKSWSSRNSWSKKIKKKVKVATEKVQLKGEELQSEKVKVAIKKIVENKDDKLTEKQKKFVIYYLQSFNGTQSAIKAGYSPTGAFVEGSRMLKNAKVVKYINEIRALQLESLMLDSKDILQRHAKIANSNILDFLGEGNKMKPIDEMDGTLIKDISITTEEVDNEFEKKTKTSVKLKVEDRNKSLEFLTKYFGLDKDGATDKDKQVIIVDDLE